MGAENAMLQIQRSNNSFRVIVVSQVTPVLDGQTVNVLAPLANLMAGVKSVEENDENDDDHDQKSSTNQPPSPPERLSSLEKTDRVLKEGGWRLASAG